MAPGSPPYVGQPASGAAAASSLEWGAFDGTLEEQAASAEAPSRPAAIMDEVLLTGCHSGWALAMEARSAKENMSARLPRTTKMLQNASLM